MSHFFDSSNESRKCQFFMELYVFIFNIFNFYRICVSIIILVIYSISDKPHTKDLISWFSSLIGKYLPLKLGIPLLRITDDLYVDKPNSKNICMEF